MRKKPSTTAQKLKRKAIFTQVSTSTAAHLPYAKAVDAIDSGTGRSLVTLQLSEDTLIIDTFTNNIAKYEWRSVPVLTLTWPLGLGGLELSSDQSNSDQILSTSVSRLRNTP